jgi:hypothetical protein
VYMPSYHLKNIWSLIKINHSKEKFVWIYLRIAEWVGNYLEFIISMPEINQNRKLYHKDATTPFTVLTLCRQLIYYK